MPSQKKNNSRSTLDNPYKGLKEGAFTKQAKSHGMTVDQFSKFVIKNYKDKNSKYNPNVTTYRRALFVKNLSK